MCANQYTFVITIPDPFKSYDRSFHTLDFKMRRTRDIAFFTSNMQIYVEKISVIMLASKEATKQGGLLAFLPRVAFSSSQYVPSCTVPHCAFVDVLCFVVLLCDMTSKGRHTPTPET